MQTGSLAMDLFHCGVLLSPVLPVRGVAPDMNDADHVNDVLLNVIQHLVRKSSNQ